MGNTISPKVEIRCLHGQHFNFFACIWVHFSYLCSLKLKPYSHKCNGIDNSLYIIILGLMNGANEMIERKDDMMKWLLNRGCALCVTPPNTAFVTLRQRTTSPLSSNPLQRPVAGCCLTGFLPMFSLGHRFIETFLPGSKALCVHASHSHYDSDRVLIICVRMLRVELQTRSSDSMGRSCRAEFHSGPLLELYCLWHVFAVKE